MSLIKNLYLYTIALAIGLSACKKTEETPHGEFAQGVFVVNEGNFQDADGTVGYYDPTDGTIVQNIYEKANGSSLTGHFQSVYFAGEYAFIIDDAGSKIEVVEAETFKHVATINEGLNTPRYMTVANGKGYVSNWGEYDATNYTYLNPYVAVIDLTNFNVIQSIITDNGVEGMITVGNKIYAAASFSNVVHVIDPTNDAITGGFTTPGGPRQFAEDNTGKLWVVCYDYATASLARLNLSNELVETSFSVSNGALAIAANKAGDKIYYLCAPYGASAKVYSMESSATFAPLEPIINGDQFYGLGVDPKNEIIYVARLNGSNNGTVIRYSSDGTEMDNFPAGRFPNGFVFRE